MVLLVTGVTLSGVPLAAAQDDGGTFLSDALDRVEDEDGDGWKIDDGAAASWSAAKGWMDRKTWGIQHSSLNPFGDEPPTAAERANATVEYFNSHDSGREVWINARLNASTSHDVVKTGWKIRDTTAVWYVTADVVNGSYTNIRMVDSTDREVDDTITLCGYAAHNSKKELEYFHETYERPNESVDQSYLASMRGKYGPHVETTLYPTPGGDCSIEGVNA